MQVKKKSQKQEKRVAKELNARTVVASGALWGSKGDVKSDSYLVECKTTEKDFYSLTFKVWDKIRTEAIKDGLRVPLMCIEVQGKSYAIIEKGMLDTYLLDSKPHEVLVDKSSFRVKELLEDTPICFIMTNWYKHKRYTLVQVNWEDFLRIQDNLT